MSGGLGVEVLMILVALLVGAAVAVGLFMKLQGDARFVFQTEQRTKFALVDMDDRTAVFSCEVPFVNVGSQDGTIMDAFPRHLLPYEQFDAVVVDSRLELVGAPRTDNYFEALIVPKGTGQKIIVTVAFTAKEGTIGAALERMHEMLVDMPLDIVYQVVARTPWYLDKARMVLTSGEIMHALQAKQVAK